MAICLSEEDIQALTNKRHHSAQMRELHRLGIPCKPRSDGSLIVLRIHVESEQERPAAEPRLHLS